jgi:hypothetical protein
MTLLRPLVLLGLISLLLPACAQRPTTTPRPDDFQAAYHWAAGSMPPPYHYEYSIFVGPGPQGRIVYRPDYDFEGVPVWEESFPVTDAELEALYTLMAEQGMFTRQWQRQSDPPVGGSSEWLDVTAGGTTYRIPTYVEPRTAANAQAIFGAISALVPQELWTDLDARRAQYEAEYEQ